MASNMIRLALPSLKALGLKRAERLAAASRLDEADAAYGRLADRHPDDLDVRLKHALSAHDAGRHVEALARWDALRTRWPDLAFAWSGSASNLRELGRLEEAREVVGEALRRFPDDLIAMSEALRVHDRLGEPLRSLDVAVGACAATPSPSCARHAAARLQSSPP